MMKIALSLIGGVCIGALGHAWAQSVTNDLTPPTEPFTYDFFEFHFKDAQHLGRVTKLLKGFQPKEGETVEWYVNKVGTCNDNECFFTMAIRKKSSP